MWLENIKKREVTHEIFEWLILRTKKEKFSTFDSRETMSDRFSTHGEFPDLPIVFWGNGASNARGIYIKKENQ